jgi:putative transposase
MPRAPRRNHDGAIHHVILKGCHGARIVLDDDDRSFLLGLLADACELLEWRVLTYCLLDNHIHLALRTPKSGLSEGMQDVCATYARYFRGRQAHAGGTFQRPFWSSLILDDAYFVTVTRYIAFNPVKARLCVEPEQWRHSAHAELVGLRARHVIDVSGMFEILDPAEYAALFRNLDAGATNERDRGILMDARRGYTVREIVERRGIPARTVRRVLAAAGVKPMSPRAVTP